MTGPNGSRFVADYTVYGYEMCPRGYMKPSALSRFAQQCARDELALLTERGVATNGFSWVVRRNVVRGWRNISRVGTIRASRRIIGAGTCWLESQTDFHHGAEPLEASVRTFWVQLDAKTGRPAPISRVFTDLCRVARGTHELMWRSEADTRVTTDTQAEEIPVREADYDALGHVNNSVYFDLVAPLVADGDEILLEYDIPIPLGTSVVRLYSVEHEDRIAFALGSVDGVRPYCRGSVRTARAPIRREEANGGR